MADDKVENQQRVDKAEVTVEEHLQEESMATPSEVPETELQGDRELTIEDIMAHLEEMEDEEEESVELTPVEQIVALIKENSSQIRLTKEDEFYAEELGFEEDAVEQYLEELQNDEQYADIKYISGSKTRYFYWEEMINTNYATLMVRVEEKDLIKMVAETVRDETKRYRRPTEIKLFFVPPFRLTKEQLLEILPMIKQREEYDDIEEATASNGAMYLFSNKYMGRAHAKSIMEWQEVERFENP